MKNSKVSFRMTTFRSIFILVCMISFIGNAFADFVKYDASKGEYRRREEEKVFIVGKVVNIAYELQHRPGGADSQDALYSKGRQGLEVSGGTIWTFVDNIKGQQLQWNQEYLGKYLKILGWVFHDAHYLEVDSFVMEGKEYIWNETKATFEPYSKTFVSPSEEVSSETESK